MNCAKKLEHTMIKKRDHWEMRETTRLLNSEKASDPEYIERMKNERRGEANNTYTLMWLTAKKQQCMICYYLGNQHPFAREVLIPGVVLAMAANKALLE
jgi:hypothetical protein